MGEPNGTLAVDTSGLRERLPKQPDAPQQAESIQTAQEAVKEMNAQEQEKGKDEKNTRTYGRTPDGTGEYLRTRILLA
jgi:phosphatidylethanolamine N-methyltransferase